jgi:energy-coupling factor transporter ATP-binding protein EcfA2
VKLIKAQVVYYRSVRDSTEFEVEPSRTILVGPNEAGKTALLRALKQINPPPDVPKFQALRDYPRASYNDITTAKVDPAKLDVVIAKFALEKEDNAAIDPDFRDFVYVIGRRMDNSCWHLLEGAPKAPTYGELRNDLARLAAHMDGNVPAAVEGAALVKKPSETLAAGLAGWSEYTIIKDVAAAALQAWLSANIAYVSEADEKETQRYDKLQAASALVGRRTAALKLLLDRVPVFVLFSNYFRVRPIIHLEHLATRIESNLLDDVQYDYGNVCLLKLLGFSARELSDLGKAT